MTIEQAEIAAARMNTRVIENYSGRGMYGKTCPAIVTDDPVLLGYTLAQIEEESGDEVKLPQRRDQMGKSAYVYY